MNNDRQQKFRAVLLAAIMVTSVVALGMGPIGTVAAQQADGSATFTLDDVDEESFARGETTENNIELNVSDLNDSNYTVRLKVEDPNGEEVDLTGPDDVTIDSIDILGESVDVVEEGDSFYVDDTRNANALVSPNPLLGNITLTVDDQATFGEYELNATVVEWDQEGISGGAELGDVPNTGTASATVSIQDTLNASAELNADPESVFAEQITSVSMSVDNHIDDVDATYDVTDPNGDEIRSGSADDGTFSWNADPVGDDMEAGDEYEVTVTYEDDKNNSGVITTNVTVVPEVTIDFQLDKDPAFGDTFVVSGQLSNDGDEFDNDAFEQLNITNEDTGEVLEEDLRVLSDGTIDDAEVDADDAGDFIFQYEDETGAYDISDAAFTIAPQDASVTIETDGDNLIGFEETYGVSIEDADGEPLTIENDANVSDGDSEQQGYVTIVGPWNGTVDTANNGTILRNVTTDVDGEDQTVLIHAQPDSDGLVEFDATPTGDEIVDEDTEIEFSDGSEVVAALENADSDFPPDEELSILAGLLDNEDITLFDGVENLEFESPASPDYVGSATADVSTSDEDMLVSIEKPSDALNVGPDGEIDVRVVGADNQKPDANNSLASADVTISAEDIGIEEQSILLNGTNTADSVDSDIAEFDNLAPEQGGEVTVSVVGTVSETDEEVTETLTVPVDGDRFADLTPTQVEIDDTEDISLTVTDTDETPLNNRVINLTHSEDDNTGFNVTDDDGDFLEGDSLQINGPDGEVRIDTDGDDVYDTLVSDIGSINNGEYAVSDVTFQDTGDVSLDISRSDGTLRATAPGAITVSGTEVYEVESDVDPILVGSEEQHNLTVFEDGEQVIGSDLDNIDVDSVQQDGTDVTTAKVLGTADLDDDLDGVDTIQVEVLADNSATEPVNISVSDSDAARSGSGSIDVVEPDVGTSLAGDDLTLGLNETDVDITAEDPRTGDALGEADVDLTAANTTFEINGEEITDGNAETITLDENGTATASIAPNASEASEDDPVSLSLDVNVDGTENFGENVIDVGEISIEFDGIDAPGLPPEEQVSFVVDVVDANGVGVDLATLTLEEGAFENARTKTLDEGTQDFTRTTTDGGSSDVVLGQTDDIDIVAADNELVLETLQVLEEVQLTLTADETDVDAGDTVEFTLEREDFDRTTSGKLTIFDADDEVVESELEIDETLEYTFEDAGEFTVEAEKDPRPQVGKTFLNDTVDVTVEEDTPFFEVTDLEPTEATVDVGEAFDVSATITNTGELEGEQDIELRLEPEGEAVDTIANVSLDADANETVTFENVSVDEPGEYNHTVASVDDSATGSLTVTDDDAPDAPDVTGDGNPATDTTGDGLLNDVDGDGDFDIFDVQALFDNRDSAAVQENVELFDFDGDGDVDIFDVQALFDQLQNQ